MKIELNIQDTIDNENASSENLCLLLAGVILLLGGTIAYVSRDNSPTHPSLVNSDLPTLIPVRDFYANADAEWHSPSFDGSLVAWNAVEWTTTVIRVKRVADQQVLTTLSGAKIR